MTARLIPVRVPSRPAGVVLVLHGGAARPGRPMVRATQLSVVRMIPIARRIARAGRGRLAVYRLLNSTRGWDDARTPVDDVHWALRQLAPDLPVCLVGHSLGGRAALLAGDAPPVRSVVALAPWVYVTDAAAGLAGRRVLIVHGTRDRVAPLERAAAVAGNLARTGAVEFVEIAGGRHAMLRHGRAFERLAADFAVATLLSDDEPTTGYVATRTDG